MSMIARTLRCGFCGHEWDGLWDAASSMRPDMIVTCPKCKSLRGKPKAFGAPADTDNYFAVGLDSIEDGVNGRDGATFNIPGTNGNRVFRLQGTLPRDMALNFAAWLVRVCDPSGEDFQRLYEEIRKR